ncbi:hypothetical protein E1165_05785 [Micromonospora sp. KC723]|nr:hypothetical protein E1165_05785 [Micromonospora sp. KC723]
MSELAADGIPVAVTCRVWNIARQPYYRWLTRPVTTADLVTAWRRIGYTLVDTFNQNGSSIGGGSSPSSTSGDRLTVSRGGRPSPRRPPPCSLSTSVLGATRPGRHGRRW